jgi:hypothetical protein
MPICDGTAGTPDRRIWWIRRFFGRGVQIGHFCVLRFRRLAPLGRVLMGACRHHPDGRLPAWICRCGQTQVSAGLPPAGAWAHGLALLIASSLRP